MAEVIANIGGFGIEGIYKGHIGFTIYFTPDALRPDRLIDENKHDLALKQFKQLHGRAYDLTGIKPSVTITVEIECIPGWEGLYRLLDSALREYSKGVRGPRKIKRWQEEIVQVSWDIDIERYIEAVRELLLTLGIQLSKSNLEALEKVQLKLVQIFS